jgi:hypothetical protein
MNDALCRFMRIRRDLRQITWMAAAVIIRELILLVQPFSE